MAQVRVRKRGKTFSYVFEAGKIDGKRKVVEKGGYPTKAEAYKAGVSAYNDFLHGNIGITSESVTLKDFMTAWLDNVVALNVKPTTLQTYKTLLPRQILPSLGKIKIQELTPAILDKWIRTLQKGGLSYNTLSATHSLIRNALNYAVHPAQLISSNPASYIKVPKNAPRNIIKRYVISPERFKEILSKHPFGEDYYIPLLLLYYTGMRLGEMLGLMWDDVDFTAKKITLHRQIRYLSRRGHYFTTLKTKSSERYIIVNDYLLNELRRWQARQVENENIFGGSYVYIYREDDGHIIQQSKAVPALNVEKVSLLCTRNDGQLYQRTTFTNLLRNERINAHSFRHTHATQLIENGAKPKGVAERLGHANALITQNLYTHNTLKLQKETAAIFDDCVQTKL